MLLCPLLLTELEQRGCSQRSEVGQHLLHESQPCQLQRDQQYVHQQNNNNFMKEQKQ